MAKPAAQPHIASAYTYAELGDGRAQHAALAEECALAISYNDLNQAVMMVSPYHLEDFAVGFSFGNDLIKSIDDIKRLETITDLETLKAQAKQLIKGKPARRMKPEKIAYFYDRVDGLTSRLSVIKMMYDLLLAGEGHKVIGQRHSMDPNVYQRRFGETKDSSPGKIDAKEDPCWKGYHMVGTKKKAGREVPNCVPGKKGATNEDAATMAVKVQRSGANETPVMA